MSDSRRIVNLLHLRTLYTYGGGGGDTVSYHNRCNIVVTTTAERQVEMLCWWAPPRGRRTKTQYTILAYCFSIFLNSFSKIANYYSKPSFKPSAVTLCRKKSLHQKVFSPTPGHVSLLALLWKKFSRYLFGLPCFMCTFLNIALYVWSFWLKRNWPSDIRYALRTFKLKTRGHKSKCQFILTKSNIKLGCKLNSFSLRSCFHYFLFSLIDHADLFECVKCTKYFHRYWTTDADPRWFWLMVRVASSIEDPMLSAASRWFYYYPIWVFRKTLFKWRFKFICLFNLIEQLGENILGSISKVFF